MLMRRLLLLLVFVFSISHNLSAKDDPHAPAKTEQELIGKLLNTLQYSDTITYTNLFLSADTVWKMIFEYRAPDTGVEEGSTTLTFLMQHHDRIYAFDPAYNPDIIKDFIYVSQKGADSGIHWKSISLVRYQLIKEKPTRDLIGYDRIATNRLRGYIFIKDDITRKEYCFTVSDMQKIGNYWYGGHLLNVYEASTIDQFEAKMAGEIKKKKQGPQAEEKKDDEAVAAKANADDKDDEDADKKAKAGSLSVKTEDDNEKDNPEGKEVVDRKIYRGTFDKEIPIILYVRYIKGGCPEKVCYWQAIYKFGDQDDYIKLDVSKTDDGKWLFVEDPAVGSMELTLKGKIYTGNWSSSDVQTGYDVKLTETAEPPKRYEALDKIIESGAWAKPEKSGEEKEEKPGPVIGADNVY